jgi:ABC-type cobalamin/Fe3+-siderophores transport system ATPase subunit
VAKAVSNSLILILDEPTSALDIQSESEIMETIFQLDRNITINDGVITELVS